MYRDSDAHKSSPLGRKSPRPLNGQEALNNSIPVKDGTHRIAISDDTFVILRQTRPDEYHGYTCSWKKLHTDFQNTLRDANLVNYKGKIL